jgi:hypothetical protein
LGVGLGLVFWLRPLFMNIGRGDNWSNLAAALTLFGASGALFGFYQ